MVRKFYAYFIIVSFIYREYYTQILVKVINTSSYNIYFICSRFKLIYLRMFVFDKQAEFYRNTCCKLFPSASG